MRQSLGPRRVRHDLATEQEKGQGEEAVTGLGEQCVQGNEVGVSDAQRISLPPAWPRWEESSSATTW